LQASRRSWRIGQTEPVKVYYFAYEETIQEDALHLVAAKVAAALRVNGDTVADDSLAELDGITGSDIVATLARIVAGDVEVNTQSLQQAFAKANDSLHQSNTVIGEYEFVDDDEDEGPLPALKTIGQQPVLSGSTKLSLPKEPLPIAGNGQPVNGHTYQPPLFSGNQAKPNGAATSASLNGKGKPGDNGSSHHQEEVTPTDDGRPPVPRPRLLI